MTDSRTSGMGLAIASYVFLGGLISLLGWVLDRPRLTDWTGSGTSIQPNASLCALAAGLALLLMGVGWKRWSSVVGAAIALIGFSTLIEILSRVDLHIDTLLMFGHAWGSRGTLSAGRMGPPASLSWTLIGIALVLASSAAPKVRRFVPALASAICAIASLSLIGFLFGAHPLHGLPQLTLIAFQTSTFIFATGIGLMAAVPERGLFAMLRRDDAAGFTARVAVPALIVPLVLGWIRLAGEQAGLYDSAFGTAVRTLSEIGLLSILLWWAATSIARIEDQRRNDRNALQVRDRLLGAVTEHAAVGLAIVDPEHRYLYANRKYSAVLDLPDRIVGHRLEDALETVYAAQIRPRLHRAFAGERVHFELIVPTSVPPRRERVFDVICEPQREGILVESVVVAIADITDRKGVESSLRDQAELLDLAHDAIMLLDMDGTIVSWNNGAIETYGFSRGEALGRVAHELLKTVFPRPLEEIRRIAEQQGRWEGELVHTRRDGRSIVVASRWAVQTATAERPARVMEINRDVTQRKQTEEALRDADRRKDEFLATLAHELRNPLAPIRNAVQLLRLQSDHDPSSRTAHEIIDRQLEHMVRLVDDLLEVSRITTGRIELKKQRVDLGTIVAQAVETVRNLIDGHRHRLTILLPPDPIALDADPVRLTQVIANLLNNACKYTPDGGSILVGARRDEGHVIVTVRDSGAGIPPPMLDKVFGLFTQIDRSLERSTGGLGIGLHLVKRLVEMHGGTVSARSEGEHKGSEFEFRLPVPSAARSLSDEAINGSRARPSTAQRRILLVDDNRDSVESLAMLLGHHGHETEIAYDGQQAVEKAERWKPDVILLDIGLPILNGYDACRAIRRLPLARDIRIIALSGWGQEQDRSNAKEAGFDDHLVKPVSFPVLTRMLDETEPAEA